MSNSPPNVAVRFIAQKNKTILNLLIKKQIPINANCGGRGRCGQCRVRLKGKLKPPDEIETLLIPQRLLNLGYRLACRYRVNREVEIILPKKKRPEISAKSAILHSRSNKFENAGFALDIGTTVIKGALVNLKTGKVVNETKIYNPQNSLGGDVITRIGMAINGKEKLLRRLLFSGIRKVAKRLNVKKPKFTTIVGNPVMLSFYLGKSVRGLSRYPFQSEIKSATFLKNPPRYIFPTIGGFVGGDTIAGIFASGIFKNKGYSLYVDLGTNGEIALVSSQKIIAVSTAAGPAFEGVGISCGSLAVPGAIAWVKYKNGFKIQTIKNQRPVGFCASGLIDLLAIMLDLGLLKDDGRLIKKFEIEGICIEQDDIRKLQLAIGAIHTGIQVLLEKRKLKPEDVVETVITGEFGGHLDLKSLGDIGVIPKGLKKVRFESDLPLQGAIMTLTDDNALRKIEFIEKHSVHLKLASQPDFQKKFIAAMKIAPWH